jgi:hypothetical protein
MAGRKGALTSTEPSISTALSAAPRLPGGGGHPGFFQTIIGAISELPRQQPIRDNLEAIELNPAFAADAAWARTRHEASRAAVGRSRKNVPPNRQQPIRDNLEAIAARSGRIDRMQAIVAAIREDVERKCIPGKGSI